MMSRSNLMRASRRLAALVLSACAFGPLAAAEPPTSPPSRWAASLAEFAAADRASPPATGGVVFVGSSSIRLWQQLPQDFSHAPVVLNRGFGGSTMADCHAFARQLVLPYRPRHVLVYAGENDLAEGRSPEEVLASFRGFVDVVRAELPGTRISYISIKPSPSRAGLLPQVRQANALLAAYVNTLPDAGFIDVFTPMIDGTGQPRTDLFGPDRLHMNPAGYALWKQVIASHVVVAPPAPSPPAEIPAPVEAAAPVR